MNQVKTTLVVIVTASLSPAIFAIGGLVATIAAGVFAFLAMTLTLLEIFALREVYLKNQARNAISELEFSGSLSSKESAHMKDLVAQSSTDKVLCEYLISQLDKSGKFSSDEISGFNQLSKTGRALFKIQLQVSNKMNDVMLKELEAAVDNLEDSSFKKQLKDSFVNQNKTAFRKALISHFREIAKEKKAIGNHVDAYMKLEWAQIIELASAQDVIVKFIRIYRQQNLFISLDEKLNEEVSVLQKKVIEFQKEHPPSLKAEKESEDEIDKKPKSLSLPDKEFDQLIKNIKTLHAQSAELLNNYLFISDQADYLFALYRGNYAQKFRLINDILKVLYPQYKESLSDLPLSPTGGKTSEAKNPFVGSVINSIEIKAKLFDKDKLKLTTTEIQKLESQLHSLERTEKDLEIVKTARNEECQTKDGLDTLAAYLDKKMIIIMPCSFGTGHINSSQGTQRTHFKCRTCEDYRSDRLQRGFFSSRNRLDL